MAENLESALPMSEGGDVVEALRTRLPELVERLYLPMALPGFESENSVEGWRLVEPNIFTHPGLGSMQSDRWRFTVEYLSRAHDLTPLQPESVYPSEFPNGRCTVR
jgi:hypothetical protein